MLKCLNFSQLLIILSILLSSVTRAQFDSGEIEKLISLKGQDIESSVDRISGVFLGRKYNTSGPLGEGEEAKYDQDPLWRTDEFDCTTYVETIMAIILSDSVEDFQQRMTAIRYLNGEVSFVTRNHFTSLDWVPRNIEEGFIADITDQVFDSAAVKEAKTVIKKKSWYEKMGESRLSLISKSSKEKNEALEQLRNEGHQFDDQEARLNYMPIAEIFDHKGRIKNQVFKNIRSAHIINIVRPDWNLEKYIGTNINVSHQGLAIRKSDGLYFRHASPSGQGVVTEQKLEDYLRKYINHKTIKGINILEILY